MLEYCLCQKEIHQNKSSNVQLFSLQVHLRKFLQGRYTARDPRIRDPAPEEIREPSPEPPGAEAGAAYPEEMASDGQEVDGSE